MKHLALILLTVLIGCSSPNDPTDQGFESNSVPGEWTFKGTFSIRLSGEYVSADPYGYEAFVRKPGGIKVNGDNLTFWIQNPFHVEASDVLYFDGTIMQDKIVGKYWTNYNAFKANMTLVRTK